MSSTRIGPMAMISEIRVGERRGFALMTVILLTLAMAAIAASGIYLAGNTGLIATSVDREREFKYGAEAAMAIGKSRLNTDPLVLPDTGFITVMSNQQITGADGKVLPGVTVNLYIGPTGSTTGQFGRFASVVAEARDLTGARFVRRLELTQESFARFAYWSDNETNNGNTIYFANQDNLWGPVWSNDNISIASSGAHFHNEVGTAGTISGKGYGVFDKGYSEKQPAIQLPSNTALSKLKGFAGSGFMDFSAAGQQTPAGTIASPNITARLEFVAIDLGTGTADSTGSDEGFFKVYVANAGQDNWLRGDWTSTKANATNCGAFYTVAGGVKRFFPASVHVQNSWFTAQLQGGGMTLNQANAAAGASLNTIMAQASAACFLGGDNRLAAVDRAGAAARDVNGLVYLPVAGSQYVGGDSTGNGTFTPTGVRGHWLKYPGAVDARLAARRADAAYLWPLDRSQNPGTKGVIYFPGSIGLSGTLRGRVTIYATGNVVILDDQRYATDPAIAQAQNPNNPTCADMLGIISANNIDVADNALNGPQDIGNWKNFDGTQDVFIHGVMMAIKTSFEVENYNNGPTNANDCQGSNNGRGCLFLNGGLIQESRGAVGQLSGEGYIKRYTYDHCAVSSPPPYFPTTGRYLDNRYYEIDPVRFNIQALFAGLTPN